MLIHLKVQVPLSDVYNETESGDGVENQVLNAAAFPIPSCRTTRTSCRLRCWNQQGSNSAQ